MIDSEITFVDQLLHHRAVRSQIKQTHFTWNRRSSWYPEAQVNEYSQISAIYEECLDKYGPEKFGYYATRNRLNKKYTEDTFDVSPEEQRRTIISMSSLEGYKVPKTTNGIYGSVRPSQLYFCMNTQN